MLFKNLTKSNLWQETLNEFAKSNGVALLSVNLDGKEISINGEQPFIYKVIKDKNEIKEYRFVYIPSGK